MRYGHFDNDSREYVIERPDTPKAWTNYLGDTRYGSVITNHGGGYSFYESAAVGRLMRFRSNAVPDGMPGRLFYMRDQESGKFWSATWQPVGDVEGFEGYECRHGTAYTTIMSRVDGIETNATYYVPLGQHFEVWRLKVTNKSDRTRKISVNSFCEFTTDRSLQQDLVNLQYTAYIVQAKFFDGPTGSENQILDIGVNSNLSEIESRPNYPSSKHLWMTLTGAKVTGYDTDREAFLGNWGTYARPDTVVAGKLTNSLAYGDTAIGTLGTQLDLAPGETREINVLLGVGSAENVGREIVAKYGDAHRLDKELSELKAHWHARLESFSVKSPDADFDNMVNTWGLYNCLITFAWSRAASLVYNGERDGLGYRDTVQDILGVVAAIPDEAQQRLELMITGQLSHGGAMPVVRPFVHKPGHEKFEDEEELRSDDCQWLFNTVPAFVAETGRFDFYNKVLPYADKGEASVFGHLRRALEFNLQRKGANGLPCGLAADWNDCLKLGYRGESIFVTFQVRFALGVYAEIAESLGKKSEADWAMAERETLDKAIAKSCWDGEWFRWAIGQDRTIYGTKDQPEGQVYINTQAWAVISGAATDSQAYIAMDTVAKRLATKYGLVLCDPAIEKMDFEVMRAVLFNPGTKENAGIFSHPQSWGVMAECILGNGDRAMDYHKAYLPSAQNDQADVRGIEPYVHCQSTHGKHSTKFGRSRLPWLTGAATWTYHSATQYILGIRPEAAGMTIDPCIPKNWDGFSVQRIFRGKKLAINVTNPNHVNKGVTSITIDGNSIDGNTIDVDMLHDGSKIVVVMG